MCLAIPAQVKEIDEGNLATVDILGVTREISLDLTPQAEVGSYVLVHAGFAIEVVNRIINNLRNTICSSWLIVIRIFFI